MLLVPTKTRLQAEADTALVTFVVQVRVLTVTVAMHFQGVACGEGFVANMTTVTLNAVMGLSVLLEMTGFFECSGANFTQVTSLCIRTLQMLLAPTGHGGLYYVRYRLTTNCFVFPDVLVQLGHFWEIHSTVATLVDDTERWFARFS